MSSVTATPTGASSAGVEGVPDAGNRSAKTSMGRVAEQTWIWAVVGYSILRAVVAWGAFSDHGVNVWVFAVIDIATAWPYGKGVALVCRRIANSEWKRLPAPLAVAVVCFFAPYAYIWFSAGEMPADVRLAMALFVTVLFLAALVGIVAKSRKLRREASHEPIEIDVRQPANAIVKLASVDGDDAPVIDLRGDANTPELIIDLTDGAMKTDRRTLRS